MESLVDAFHDLDTSQKVLCAVGGVVTVVGLRKLFFKVARAKKEYPRDTVILHQFNRGLYAPSLSPFVMKMETYLRMAKIPYQNDHGMQPASKGKIPWMEYNGQELADTTLCIKFLNQKLGVDLNNDLSPADRGIAQAMQVLVEDHLYWILVAIRWNFDNDYSFALNSLKFGRFRIWMIGRTLRKQVWNQGLGRHTEGEITEMLMKDLQSLSDFIGTKKFLMGDQPCETDCTVFGFLSYIHWHFMGTKHETIIKDKYPNMAAYCERMKDTFWPDWDQCITHGGTREATK